VNRIIRTPHRDEGRKGREKAGYSEGQPPPKEFLTCSAVINCRFSLVAGKNGQGTQLNKPMVARGGPIRKANQDSKAARRAKIGHSRSESIEPPTRGFSERQVIDSDSIY
jgi:hypothetical protein